MTTEKVLLHAVLLSRTCPDTLRVIWCKNCEKPLGFLLSTSHDSKWDLNDPSCPFCGDNAAMMLSAEGLARRFN